MRIYPKLVLLFLGLAAIPLVLVVGIFLYNSQKELTNEIFQRLNAVSVLKRDRLETFFASARQDVKAAQEFLDVRMDLPTLQEFDHDRTNFVYFQVNLQLNDQLRGFMNSHQYADIMLLNTKGRVIFVSNPNHVKSYLDKTIFSPQELQQAQNRIFISDPAETTDPAYPYVLHLVSQARDMQDNFTGYVVLQVDMRVIYNFISNNTGVGLTGETFLVKKMPDDRFLFISPLLYQSKAVLNKNMASAAKEAVDLKNSAVSSMVRESRDYRGKEVLSMRQHILSLDWELITKIDQQEVFAPVNNMRNLFFTIFTLILFLIALSSAAFAESISKPIYKLQEGTEIVGQGNLDHKVGLPDNDEVGQLSRAFDRMVENLKKITASRDELEKEIVNRKKAEEQLKVLAEELRAMSVHDPLTGVLNRRGLQEVLGKMLGMSQRMGFNVQVLLLDMDNFKQINDQHGHGIGDTVLMTAVDKIRLTVRKTDYTARVGGDEFMVLLVESGEADAVKVADKIRLAIAQSVVTVPTGEMVKATCSIGIVPLGDTPISIDGLLQKLHLSLHLSKDQGKNRIAYHGADGAVELRNPDTTAEFKKVLLDGRKFYAASQPIFNLQDMTRSGYELLSRLDYEGYVSPDTFLSFARNADLLGIVDYACLKNCLNSLKDIPAARMVHINIFPSTLTEVPVERLIRDFSLCGADIKFCLEINEQQILGDPFYLVPSVVRLKEAGVSIALDDYGFGRSSVETLMLLEPDVVKIDKKIIKNIAQDERKLVTLKRLLRMMASCDATVIAEGIETDEDLQMLLGLGVTLGQGYLMGRPEVPPNFA